MVFEYETITYMISLHYERNTLVLVYFVNIHMWFIWISIWKFENKLSNYIWRLFLNNISNKFKLIETKSL